MTEKSITQQLEAGERARLIPVTSPGQKELAAQFANDAGLYAKCEADQAK